MLSTNYCNYICGYYFSVLIQAIGFTGIYSIDISWVYDMLVKHFLVHALRKSLGKHRNITMGNCETPLWTE